MTATKKKATKLKGDVIVINKISGVHWFYYPKNWTTGWDSDVEKRVFDNDGELLITVDITHEKALQEVKKYMSKPDRFTAEYLY